MTREPISIVGNDATPFQLSHLGRLLTRNLYGNLNSTSNSCQIYKITFTRNLSAFPQYIQQLSVTPLTQSAKLTCLKIFILTCNFVIIPK